MKIETTLLCALLAMMLFPPAAVAQTSSEAGFALEEIVITARRREESLQEVPIAVTGFNASQILDADIERVEDFIQLVPNVTIATSQGIGTSFITIRGQTQTRNGESPVAVIVDGVLQIDSRQFRQELFDVQSIQVAKGPQGAIYGRNATGGAIIVDTKKPSFEEVEGYATAGFGDGSEFSLGATVSAPLADNLAGSIAVNYTDRDGYLDNITTGEEDDPFEDLAVRGRLLWESNGFSADFKANVARHDGRAIGFQFQGADLAADGITGTGFGTDTGPIDADNVVTIRANNPDEGDRDSLDLSLKLDWELSFGSFTSTTAYNAFEEFGSTDQFPYTAAIDSDPDAAGLFGFDGTQTQFVDLSGWSQEFRITSSSDQSFRWNAGVYYLTWDRFISSTTGTDLGLGVNRIERTPAPVDDPINPTEDFLADDNDNTAWAVFGQVNYDVSDKVELSLALRYDREDRDQSVSPLQVSTGGFTQATAAAGNENSESFDAFQPKFTVRYTPSDFSTYYATWGVGFRSGQFNPAGIATVDPAFDDVIDQEDTTSTELGFKHQFLNDRLRLNGAVFNTDIENSQYFIFVGAISGQILLNIEEVSVFGAEMDISYGINENWGIYGAYGYTDSEVDQYDVDPSLVGNEAPYIPGSTFNLGAQYNAEVANGLGFVARADYERRGSQFWDPENSTDRSALNLLNLRVALEGGDGRWSVSGTVDNATDEIYNSEYVAVGFSAAAPGRIWGIDYRYNF